MSPDEKELLLRAVELGEENHKMLKSLYRASIMGRITKAIYWIIIIIATGGAYYALQPYIDLAKSNYEELKSKATSISDTIDRVGGIQNDLQNITK